MPIYEYKCGSCGALNEFIVLGKNETMECKTCRSRDLTKLMSAHNIAGPAASFAGEAGGCCGSPNSCGAPGSCCSG